MIFKSKYLFTPSGETQETVEILKKSIEFIGSKQAGIGSNYAKGKRYLKKEFGCSGTAIKYLFKTFPKRWNHKYETLGIYVYRFDKNKCVDILLGIINFFETNANDTEIDRFFYQIVRPIAYLDVLFSTQEDKIEWVYNHNYQDQREDADKILQGLKTINNILH